MKACKTPSKYILRHVPNDEFVVEREVPVTTIADLLKGFYKWYKGTTRRPLRFEINPEINGVCVYDPTLNDDTWLAIYQRHYYVSVYKGSSYNGPHRAVLYYKPHRKLPTVRLGVAQIVAQFYSEKEMGEALKDAIKFKEYFATDASLELIVPLEPETET